MLCFSFPNPNRAGACLFFALLLFLYHLNLGEITTIAGNSFGDSTGDGGAAALSTVNNPYGIALHRSTGDVYFAEYSGQRVRKIDAATGGCSRMGGVGGAARCGCVGVGVCARARARAASNAGGSGDDGARACLPPPPHTRLPHPF